MANIRIGKGHTFNVGVTQAIITRCGTCGEQVLLHPQTPGQEEQFVCPANGCSIVRAIDKCYNGFRW